MEESHQAAGSVLIVGASLTGLGCALALAAKGLRSTVVERVADFGLSGGGLGVDRRLLAQVTGLDPSVNTGGIAALTVIRSTRETTSWQLLHHWLRDHAKASPLIALKTGAHVVDITAAPHPEMTLSDGSTLTGTAILGADGYRSTVRRFVSPTRPLAAYTGYMLWRGLVSERLMPRSTVWPDNGGYGEWTDSGYRLIAYPVPGADGSTVPGERQISFAWYDTRRDDLLRRLGCLSSDGEVLATLPFQRIPEDVRAGLLAEAAGVWPRPWNLAVELAITTETLFATPISEYWPERLSKGPVALLGDAAHVATPMTGRGFAMGAVDAGLLADLLAQPGMAPTQALRRYEALRLPDVQSFVAQSQELSRRYMHHAHRSRV